MTGDILSVVLGFGIGLSLVTGASLLWLTRKRREHR